MIFPKKVLSVSLGVVVLIALAYVLVLEKAPPGVAKETRPAATAPGSAGAPRRTEVRRGAPARESSQGGAGGPCHQAQVARERRLRKGKP